MGVRGKGDTFPRRGLSTCNLKDKRISIVSNRGVSHFQAPGRYKHGVQGMKGPAADRRQGAQDQAEDVLGATHGKLGFCLKCES